MSGKLDGGPKVDPRWGNDSSVACYVDNDRFDGAHKVYAIDTPARSMLDLTITPGDPQLDLSLYVYVAGPGETERLPPHVHNTSCEVSSGTWAEPYNPGKSESVTMLLQEHPYRVFVGVVGAKGTMTGRFTLRADLKTDIPPSGKVKSATPLAVKMNATTKTSGKLDGGPKIPLDWAADSEVACFVDSDRYDGAHKLFVIEMPANSVATIKATPSDPQLDLNVYSYITPPFLGEQLPPNVTHARCEASDDHAGYQHNPGKPETVEIFAVSPTRAYIGVAGAQGAMTGGFTLSVTLRPGPE